MANQITGFGKKADAYLLPSPHESVALPWVLLARRVGLCFLQHPCYPVISCKTAGEAGHFVLGEPVFFQLTHLVKKPIISMSLW